MVEFNSSYKRVKGRIHTAEKRSSMHSHRSHATSKPIITVLTDAQFHRPTSAATSTAFNTCLLARDLNICAQA